MGCRRFFPNLTLVRLGASQEQVMAGHASERERMRRGISLGVEIHPW